MEGFDKVEQVGNILFGEPELRKIFEPVLVTDVCVVEQTSEDRGERKGDVQEKAKP